MLNYKKNISDFFFQNQKKIFLKKKISNFFFNFEKKNSKYFFCNSICNNEVKKVKTNFFDKTKNHDVVYFTQMKNHRSEKYLLSTYLEKKITSAKKLLS